MPIITFSNKEILRGKIVEPAWYLLDIESCSEGNPSRDGGSINYELETGIVKNDDDGTTTFAEVPITIRFNSKAKGFMIPYFQAFGIEVEKDKRYELAATVGKQVVAFVENGMFEGKPKNEVNHKYRSPRG